MYIGVVEDVVLAPCGLGAVVACEELPCRDNGADMPYAVLLVRPMVLLYLFVEVFPEGVEGGAEGAGDLENVFGCGVGLPHPYWELPTAWEAVSGDARARVWAYAEAWG